VWDNAAPGGADEGGTSLGGNASLQLEISTNMGNEAGGGGGCNFKRAADAKSVTRGYEKRGKTAEKQKGGREKKRVLEVK